MEDITNAIHRNQRLMATMDIEGRGINEARARLEALYEEGDRRKKEADCFGLDPTTLQRHKHEREVETLRTAHRQEIDRLREDFKRQNDQYVCQDCFEYEAQIRDLKEWNTPNIVVPEKSWVQELDAEDLRKMVLGMERECQKMEAEKKKETEVWNAWLGRKFCMAQQVEMINRPWGMGELLEEIDGWTDTAMDWLEQWEDLQNEVDSKAAAPTLMEELVKKEKEIEEEIIQRAVQFSTPALWKEGWEDKSTGQLYDIRITSHPRILMNRPTPPPSDANKGKKVRFPQGLPEGNRAQRRGGVRKSHLRRGARSPVNKATNKAR